MVTNTHTPETLDIIGSKTWDDADDRDGIRPESITVRFHADGKVVQDETVTDEDGWSWTFVDLPFYSAGHQITYTITEDAVDDYAAEYDGYDVTNAYTPGQTSVTVLKDWEDADNQDGKRPDEITVKLLADGEATGQTLTLSEENGWEDTFTELDEYQNGARIAYTVQEADVDDYESSVIGDATQGLVITNTPDGGADDESNDTLDDGSSDTSDDEPDDTSDGELGDGSNDMSDDGPGEDSEGDSETYLASESGTGDDAPIAVILDIAITSATCIIWCIGRRRRGFGNC